jgi:AAA domain
MLLEDYPRAQEVREAFRTYLESRWKPWSEEEKKRREAIRVYAKLFTLRQQLEGGLVEAPSELVWGIGIGVWDCNGTTIHYPLLTQAVEISLNQLTSEIQIAPRDMEPHLETDWYASMDNPGLAALEQHAREFFANSSVTLSPYDSGGFEPLLRAAAANLDPGGEYWPDHAPAGNRTIPQPERRLRVTDTWVLFARPRQRNLFVRDLENFKTKLLEDGNSIKLPPAVHQVVTEASSSNFEVTLPRFRGLSATGGDSGGTGEATDLYFPKPFNDEQVRILQLLEVSDGVVVQGPPGTGKTHTIANIISHYLANGKRVLVSSMKEPALGEVRDKLPADIRPLAISLLTSEHEGIKQFEHAIQRIASEVQSLDRTGTRRDIAHIEESIDALHAALSRIDTEIERWARANLEPICIDGERLSPYEAARLTVESRDTFSWLKDELSLDDKYNPRFGQKDILRLREARRKLGRDIEYLNATVPELCDFPTPDEILQAHRDLSRLAELESQVKSGAVPEVAVRGDGFEGAANKMISEIREVRRLGCVLEEGGAWTEGLRKQFLNGSEDSGSLRLLENLGTELKRAVEKRQDYLARPVSVPLPVLQQAELQLAIANLSEGKKAFGAFGIFGKSEQKRQIGAITVLGHPPASSEDWEHVLGFIRLQQELSQLALKWNAVAGELPIPSLPGVNPDNGLAATKYHEVVEAVKEHAELQRRLTQSARELVPSCLLASDPEASEGSLKELEGALQHHIARQRLGHVWSVKQSMLLRLEGKSGPITERLRNFASDTLGNPAVPDSDAQRTWSDLMRELGRIHGLRSYFATVADVTGQITSSGAPLWSEALKRPVDVAVDSLLPDDWQRAWRCRRIATHLAAIDQEARLHELSSRRKELEEQLADSYRDIVVKKTWLKLAENASPKIRAALQAYLNAIQKIGKGTGKRAVRYRQDARHAAEEANPAVPCWIMPHYRVSESLPCEFGCFHLVIIDEASQSDLTALPALLRAQKVLIVGDDKQVSPEGVGLEEEKVRSLMQRFLGNQVPSVRAQLSPERSIYDLFKVVFASSSVMLKEHFRCVPPIIKYSKQEFYSHELRPLRRPKPSERLDPPLVDVLVEDGYRHGDVNRPEARFIVGEIKRLIADPNLGSRSIGIVSLLGESTLSKSGRG